MPNQERRVKANDRQRQALELRKAGFSYPTIAERLGYASPQAAFKAVDTALKKSIQEPADELRTLEVERLDGMLASLASQVKQGNHSAIDRALRIMERRAKLLGLDAPERQVIEMDDPIAIVVDK